MQRDDETPVHLFTNNRRIVSEVTQQLQEANLRVEVHPMADLPPAGLAPGSCSLVEITPRDSAWRSLIQQLVADSREPIVGVTVTPAVRDAIDAIAMGAADVADLDREARDLLLTVRRVVERTSAKASPGRRPRIRLNALTSRQREVLALATAGLSSKEIAARLHVSKRTVDAHRRAMIQAAEAQCFIDLIREYVRQETLRSMPDAATREDR